MTTMRKHFIAMKPALANRQEAEQDNQNPE
jgi:hypothetical protein